MSDAPDSEIAQPSRFWQRLSDGHQQQLDSFGFAECKRRQALEYFNWRFRPEHLHVNDQAAFLTANTSRFAKIKAKRAIDVAHSEWNGMPWSNEERAVYAYYTRLLWEYAKRRGDRAVCALSEPELGAPLPIFYGKRRISQDLANSALEVRSIREALGAAEPARVLELGAGYGRNAWALLSIFPTSSYTIVDIEPARSISEWYLSRLFPDRELRFLSPDELVGSDLEPFDLVFSISSLHEMTQTQIAHYLERLGALTGDVLYIKQWTEWDNPDDHYTARFADYPIPASWAQLYVRPCEVQTLFTEGAWRPR